MARQQPVAVDLRMVITALRMGTDLERMGDLAEHVAKVARLRHPESAIPAEIRATILEMGQIAERLVTKAGSCIASRDVDSAMELEADDDAMDRLHRRLFKTLLAKDWSHGVEPAIDITLIGRYYERYADHAVRVAHAVVYLVTGTRTRLHGVEGGADRPLRRLRAYRALVGDGLDGGLGRLGVEILRRRDAAGGSRRPARSAAGCRWGC